MWESQSGPRLPSNIPPEHAERSPDDIHGEELIERWCNADGWRGIGRSWGMATAPSCEPRCRVELESLFEEYGEEIRRASRNVR